MKRIVILTLILLLPSALSEMDHSPNEVSKGDQITTWIDTENDIKEVTFYVCTLEDPYTCYKPETVERNNTTNGRFQFTYLVKENDYPGYKYELKKDGNETEKVPLGFKKYDGLTVKEMGGSHYFVINIKSQEDESALYSPNLILSVLIVAIIALTNRR